LMAHTCILCDREFKSRGALTMHQKICKENHTMHEKGRQLRQKVLHLKAQKRTSLNDRKSRMVCLSKTTCLADVKTYNIYRPQPWTTCVLQVSPHPAPCQYKLHLQVLH
jgi:hypothetical protein